MGTRVAIPRPSALALSVLLLLLVLTGVAAWFTARQVDQREDQLVDARAAEVTEAIQARLGAYTEKLYGLRGFLAGAASVTHREFHDNLVSQELSRRYPGIQVFGVAPLVTDAERDDFERRIRRSVRASRLASYPYFMIEPRGRRPEYLPVSFLEPQRGNEAAFGFDIFTEPARRAAALRARRTTEPAATAPIRLLQDRGRERGFLLVLPFYEGGNQRPLLAARARLFGGVVYAAFRTTDLLNATLRGVVTRGDVELYDVGSVDDPPRKASARGQTFNLRGSEYDALDPADDGRLRSITLAGRRLSVYYEPRRHLVAANERAIPWLIAILGLLVSLLAAGAVDLAVSQRRRAVALAERMTEDLRVSRNELARSNEELERFAFLASHDLQQPLRTVSGFLQLLDHQHGDLLDESAREYVDQALRGTKDMSQLIDDLLEFSRAGRGDRPLVPVPLSEAWDHAVGQLRATIEETRADVDREELPTVPGDPSQMTQLFANLIGNAVKYRGDAPPVVRGSAARVDGGWEVAVQDNGIGIDPADHERIFGMFRRLHTGERYEGTGVGLALAKRIVERTGGDIRVESERGRGARFVVRFPDAPEAG